MSTTKKRKVVARLVWENERCTLTELYNHPSRTKSFRPVFVLPADPESVAKIEEQIASMVFVPLSAPKGETNQIARRIMSALNLTAQPSRLGRKGRGK